jgi:DNA-binding response OmpR family regulator
MTTPPAAEALGAASLDQAITEVRTRFIAEFPIRCDTADTLIDRTADATIQLVSAQSLRTLAHKLGGLAGIIGFRRVSALATELEALAEILEASAVEVPAAHMVVEEMRAAFTHELASPTAAAADASAGIHRGDVLVVEDDDDQRLIVLNQLSAAGYRTHGLSSAAAVRQAARALSPSAILLDVEMPNVDGYSVCRELKGDPELSTIPIIFMTKRARLDDRLAGLALGADDYLIKPVDPRELVIRLERARTRDTARAEQAATGGVLSYEDFLRVARNRVARVPVAFVLMRVPAHQANEVLVSLRNEVRRADLVAPYDRTHLVLLLPELTGSPARARVNEIVNRLAEYGIQQVAAGVATAPAGRTDVETLLAEADDALMQARHCGTAVMLHGDRLEPERRAAAGVSILLADDDPDVIRILDAGLRGAGHHTTLAFDGVEALASLERDRPEVLILDLMMPKLGGFEFLNRLRDREGPRPRVIVLSARGREEDVTRAFDLGADDYVTKPFNPQELLARVARLLR